MSSEIVTILALDRFPEAEVSAIFQSTLDEALKKLHAASLVTELPYLSAKTTSRMRETYTRIYLLLLHCP